jgi:hypothetical protein
MGNKERQVSPLIDIENRTDCDAMEANEALDGSRMSLACLGQVWATCGPRVGMKLNPRIRLIPLLWHEIESEKGRR